MKFNKEAVRRELDLAAEDLEKQGFNDLADKVDFYNDRLMRATSSREVDIIRRALARVEKDATARLGKDEEKKASSKEARLESIRAKIRQIRARRVAENKKASSSRRDSAYEHAEKELSSDRLARRARIRQLLNKGKKEEKDDSCCRDESGRRLANQRMARLRARRNSK